MNLLCAPVLQQISAGPQPHASHFCVAKLYRRVGVADRLEAMDLDAEVECTATVAPAPTTPVNSVADPAKKRRGRPRKGDVPPDDGQVSEGDGGSKKRRKSTGSQSSAAGSKDVAGASKGKGGKVQCMCCSKWFDRSQMSNLRYCPKGKK